MKFGHLLRFIEFENNIIEDKEDQRNSILRIWMQIGECCVWRARLCIEKSSCDYKALHSVFRFRLPKICALQPVNKQIQASLLIINYYVLLRFVRWKLFEHGRGKNRKGIAGCSLGSVSCSVARPSVWLQVMLPWRWRIDI